MSRASDEEILAKYLSQELSLTTILNFQGILDVMDTDLDGIPDVREAVTSGLNRNDASDAGTIRYIDDLTDWLTWLQAYNLDALNPGIFTTLLSFTLDSDADGIPDVVELHFGLDRFDPADAEVVRFITVHPPAGTGYDDWIDGVPFTDSLTWKQAYDKDPTNLRYMSELWLETPQNVNARQISLTELEVTWDRTTYADMGDDWNPGFKITRTHTDSEGTPVIEEFPFVSQADAAITWPDETQGFRIVDTTAQADVPYTYAVICERYAGMHSEAATVEMKLLTAAELALLDSDGDGVNDLRELLAGTDPYHNDTGSTDPNLPGPLSILGPVAPGEMLKVRAGTDKPFGLEVQGGISAMGVSMQITITHANDATFAGLTPATATSSFVSPIYSPGESAEGPDAITVTAEEIYTRPNGATTLLASVTATMDVRVFGLLTITGPAPETVFELHPGDSGGITVTAQGGNYPVDILIKDDQTASLGILSADGDATSDPDGIPLVTTRTFTIVADSTAMIGAEGTITFEATDASDEGSSQSPNVTVTIRIVDYEHQPLHAADQTVTVAPTDTSITIQLGYSGEPDGDVSYELVEGTGPTAGTLDPSGLSSGQVIYTGQTPWSGWDSFQFKVTDSITTSIATVTILPPTPTVTITAYAPGNVSEPGPMVEGDDAFLLPNSDNDDEPAIPDYKDNADSVIGPYDNDIVRIQIDLNKNGTEGTFELNIPPGVRVFDESLTEKTDTDLDTSGQPIILYLEGLDGFNGGALSAAYAPNGGTVLIDTNGTPAAAAVPAVVASKNLQPFEILQPVLGADGNVVKDGSGNDKLAAVSTIRFCRWTSAFTPASVPVPGFEAIDKDRFFIRVAAPLGDDDEVNVGTLDLSGLLPLKPAITSDPMTAMSVFREVAGVNRWITKAMILVADRDDDVSYTNNANAGDDQKNDVTRLGSFGGKMKVNLPDWGLGATVPIMKPHGEVKIKITIWYSPGETVSSATMKQVLNSFYQARQIYTQFGIELKLLGIQPKLINDAELEGILADQKVEMPPKSRFPLGAEYDLYDPNFEFADFYRIFEGIADTDNENAVPIHYFNTVISSVEFDVDGKGYAGFRVIGGPADGAVVISQIGETAYVMAHEIGHSLGLDHAYIDEINRTGTPTYRLMREGAHNSNHTHLDPKRLTLAEVETIGTSKRYAPLH